MLQYQTHVLIDCDDLPDGSDIAVSSPNSSSEIQYEPVNEINAEARALIAAWERNNLRPVDYEPSHSPEHLRAMWAAVGVHSIADMPPPMRYRRASKNACIG
jgi:hypothetical protein